MPLELRARCGAVRCSSSAVLASGVRHPGAIEKTHRGGEGEGGLLLACVLVGVLDCLLACLLACLLHRRGTVQCSAVRCIICQCLHRDGPVGAESCAALRC